MKHLVRIVGTWWGRVLFPPVCTGCRHIVSQPGVLCAPCWAQLRHIEQPWCAVLGTPFEFDMGAAAISPGALADPPPFDRARSAVAYSGMARRLVQSLKYGDRTDLAPWMARWMLRAGAELLPDADLILAVPLHRRRFLFRRFNQSAELARALAWLTQKPFEAAAVQRVRSTRQQVGLGLAERQRNVQGAFRVAEAGRSRIKGRKVLVIDDVYTTGATVSALARALKRAGAARVDVLTFARVLPGDFRPDDGATIYGSTRDIPWLM
nr:ComF family protein [Mesorhizobium xinjiangense]